MPPKPSIDDLRILTTRLLMRKSNELDYLLRKQAIKDMLRDFGIERVVDCPADKRLEAEDRIFRAIHDAERRRIQVVEEKK
jgi:hypothetical protein